MPLVRRECHPGKAETLVYADNLIKIKIHSPVHKFQAPSSNFFFSLPNICFPQIVVIAFYL